MRRQLGAIGWWDILGKPLLAAAAMGAVVLLLLPLGKGAALLGALIAYPLAAWRLRLFSAEEQAVLKPLVRRSAP